MIHRIVNRIRAAKYKTKLEACLNNPRYRPIAGWIRTWREHPFNGWAMNIFDLFKLYDLILERQPTYAVEYGTATGFSSVIMATALQELGGQRRLITLEQDRRLYEFAKSICPYRLDNILEYKLGRITLEPFNGRKYMVYDFQADELIDFAVLDGPNSFVLETPTNGKFSVFYSKSAMRPKEIPERKRLNHLASMEVFGREHLLNNLTLETLRDADCLDENDEVRGAAARLGSLYQTLEHAASHLTIVVDGTFYPEWHDALKSKRAKIMQGWGRKTTVIYVDN